MPRLNPGGTRRIHVVVAQILSRLWKAYLRLATGLAGILGSMLLTIQYFRLIAAIRLAGQACRAPGTFGMDDGLAWTQ